MANKEEQETLRLLVQHVSRAFYEPKYTIIMDQLARHPVLKDDDLAGKMGLQPKELNKVIAVLSNDCLVKIYRQNELKEGAQRSVGRQYYYIDYEYFCNVVKWRVAKMRNIIDTSLRNELDNKGYICTQCKQSYSPLDVDKLMDFSSGTLTCEICRAEVVDNENAESVLGSKDRMQRFNHQMKFIREGLQKSESMVLPAFDVAAWVKKNFVDPEKQKSAQDGQGAGLKIAGEDPSKKGEDDTGIGVVIAMDKDEETQKQERAAEAEARRQQNMLPSWHLKSTITGDLTALGVMENARVESQRAAAATVSAVQPGSNDEILRGLGVIGVRAQHSRHQPQIQQQTMVQVIEETKTTVGLSVNYYDQYYAALAASAAASSAAPTPSRLSLPSSSNSGDGLLASEEEDTKPSVEYLESLNEYRKRSRSREDVGMGGGKPKAPKMEELENNAKINGHIDKVNGVAHLRGVVIGDSEGGEPGGDMQIGDAPTQDDPLVYVNGKQVPYSQVTEEDHDLMTPDEYTAYFEIMQAQS